MLRWNIVKPFSRANLSVLCAISRPQQYCCRSVCSTNNNGTEILESFPTIADQAQHAIIPPSLTHNNHNHNRDNDDTSNDSNDSAVGRWAVPIGKPCDSYDAAVYARVRTHCEVSGPDETMHVFSCPNEVLTLYGGGDSVAEKLFPFPPNAISEERELVRKLREKVRQYGGSACVPIAAVGIAMMSNFEMWHVFSQSNAIATPHKTTFQCDSNTCTMLVSSVLFNNPQVYYKALCALLDEACTTALAPTAQAALTPDEMVGIRQHIESNTRERFTYQHACGMMGRDVEMTRALAVITGGYGTNIKENKYPLGVISAPRQGKSLFLDILAEKADRQLKELHGEDNIVTIKVSLNGETALEKCSTAAEAADNIWVKLFGKSIAGVYDGNTARRLLERLYPGKYILLYIDELTLLTDHLPAAEHKKVARIVLSLYSRHTMLVFSGFDLVITNAFRSMSARSPMTITLQPFFSSVVTQRMALLPLRNAVLCLHKLAVMDPVDIVRHYKHLHLYYEVCKSSPGILGAIIQAAQALKDIPDSIPILSMNKHMATTVLPLLVEYTAHCAKEMCLPYSDTPLGERLLANKIGVPLSTGQVYVLPAIAFFLVQKPWLPSDAFVTTARAVIQALSEWVPTYTSSGAGERFEEFVLACIALRMISSGELGAARSLDDIRGRRLHSEYPKEPMSEEDKEFHDAHADIILTKEDAFAVDIVQRRTIPASGRKREVWVQVKYGATKIKSVQSAVRKNLWQMLANANAAGVDEVEYVVLGGRPRNRDVKDLLTSSPVKFRARFVQLGTEGADLFMTPLFASMAPMIFDTHSLERPYEPNPDKDKNTNWCAMNELDAIDLADMEKIDTEELRELRAKCIDMATTAKRNYRQNLKGLKKQ